MAQAQSTTVPLYILRDHPPFASDFPNTKLNSEGTMILSLQKRPDHEYEEECMTGKSNILNQHEENSKA